MHSDNFKKLSVVDAKQLIKLLNLPQNISRNQLIALLGKLGFSLDNLNLSQLISKIKAVVDTDAAKNKTATTSVNNNINNIKIVTTDRGSSLKQPVVNKTSVNTQDNNKNNNLNNIININKSNLNRTVNNTDNNVDLGQNSNIRKSNASDLVKNNKDHHNTILPEKTKSVDERSYSNNNKNNNSYYYSIVLKQFLTPEELNLLALLKNHFDNNPSFLKSVQQVVGEETNAHQDKDINLSLINNNHKEIKPTVKPVVLVEEDNTKDSQTKTNKDKDTVIELGNDTTVDELVESVKRNYRPTHRYVIKITKNLSDEEKLKLLKLISENIGLDNITIQDSTGQVFSLEQYADELLDNNPASLLDFNGEVNPHAFVKKLENINNLNNNNNNPDLNQQNANNLNQAIIVK